MRKRIEILWYLFVYLVKGMIKRRRLNKQDSAAELEGGEVTAKISFFKKGFGTEKDHCINAYCRHGLRCCYSNKGGFHLIYRIWLTASSHFSADKVPKLVRNRFLNDRNM